MAAPSLGSIKMRKLLSRFSLLPINRLYNNMLEGHALLTALCLKIEELRTAINNPEVIVTQVCGADVYYTDGGAAGSFLKLYPLNFYYTDKGQPHFNCEGSVATACTTWIQNVANGVN